MDALKACFEQIGFDYVSTYIQSGNVLFKSLEKNQKSLVEKIEKTLSKQFNYLSQIVLVSSAKLNAIVDHAPKGFGGDPERFRYDVIFLKSPLTDKEAIQQIRVKEGVDTADGGPGVLYFSRRIEKAAHSLLPKLAGMPIYKQMTIRNWNTTTRLLELMNG